MCWTCDPSLSCAANMMNSCFVCPTQIMNWFLVGMCRLQAEKTDCLQIVRANSVLEILGVVSILAVSTKLPQNSPPIPFITFIDEAYNCYGSRNGVSTTVHVGQVKCSPLFDRPWLSTYGIWICKVAGRASRSWSKAFTSKLHRCFMPYYNHTLRSIRGGPVNSRRGGGG